jgi:nitrate reductase gamma subunit
MTLALPVAPILLLPFIVVFFVVVFPFWLVAIAVLGLLLQLARGVEWALRAAGARVERPHSGALSSAFHWTLSWGGIAERRDLPRQESP